MNSKDMLAMMVVFVGVLLGNTWQHIHSFHSDDVKLPTQCLQYADASVQRKLCLEEEGVVLYTQGRGAKTPIRQVLNAPSVQ